MKEIIISNTLINDFQMSLKMEEKATATIEKYVRDVRAFANYLAGRSVTKALTIAYKQNLLELGYAIRSINSVIASLNSMFSFIQMPEYHLKALKVQQQVYCSAEKELTREEYKRLLQISKATGNLRLNLVIQTICGTGIRVSELSFVTVDAVKKGEALVSCKGKTRRVFLVQQLQKKLLQYITQHKIREGCIFRTRTGKPLSRTNIWREMKNLCQQAQVDPRKVFPHNLRHLFARTFYRIEKDIAKLADILGHGSINTTRIYIMTTGEEHRRRMEKMHLIL